MSAPKLPCDVCGKKVPLTASGTFRKHSTYATVCPQSGAEPGNRLVTERPYWMDHMGEWHEVDDESLPCQRIVCVGVSPTPWVRCGRSEDHPIHDPLSRYGCHVYDPIGAPR